MATAVTIPPTGDSSAPRGSENPATGVRNGRVFAGQGGLWRMLQWYPRIVLILVFALLIATFLANATGKGRGYTWE